jgi:hypothetical protein
MPQLGKTGSGAAIPQGDPAPSPRMEVHEDDRLCDGVAFMQGLVRFAQHRREALRYLQNNGELKVFRVPCG